MRGYSAPHYISRCKETKKGRHNLLFSTKVGKDSTKIIFIGVYSQKPFKFFTK